MKIVGLADGEIVQRVNGGQKPAVRMEVRGVHGEVNWMVNGRYVARTGAAAGHLLRFDDAGRYDITAFDDQGKYDRVSVSVRGGFP